MSTIGHIKGDTRSLDNGSHEEPILPAVELHWSLQLGGVALGSHMGVSHN